MKNLKEYIIERGSAPEVSKEELDKVYVVKIYCFSISFKVKDSRIHVFSVNPIGETSC